MEKVLTVIIPVYNTESYLLRCFESINHPLVNVIVIDDGSTDSSKEIIDRFCETHPNFKAIHQENQGAVIARQNGLKQVNTEYFCFVDSDDVANINNIVKLVFSMQDNNVYSANGRMTVYLPNNRIPFNSRKWKKEKIDFLEDKQEFNNVTCSLLDKVWHISCLPYFMEKSNQIIYEDMEVVYYALASSRKMIHTNDILYSYCMRGLSKDSTSAKELQVTKSNALRGVLSASSSMIDKFKNAGLYEEYENELISIIIKLVHQRILNIYKHKKIINKKEMVELVYQILSNYIPNWQENKYYLSGFQGMEINDVVYFKLSCLLNKLYGIDKNPSCPDDYKLLLREYDKKIQLREDTGKKFILEYK